MTDKDEKRRLDEKKFWSRQAVKYDLWIEHSFEDQYKLFRKRFRSAVGEQDRVLEIATGTGDIAFTIAGYCSEVVATDLSEDMIRVATGKRKERDVANVRFRVEDSYALSFDNGSFDKVICSNGLQTMKEPSKAIKEAHRVLRPGGEFLSVTYCYGDSGLVELAKLLKFAIKRGKPRYWKNLKRKELQGFFTSSGFEILESEDAWNKPVVLWLRCRKL